MTDRPTRWLLGTRTVALYAALGAAWAALAWWVVPPVIAAAYHGRSLAVLNRVFQRPSRHPLEHYHALWSALAGAALIAGTLHLALVLLLGRRGRARRERIVLVLFGAAFLAVTVLSGPRHDYVADLEIWDVVLRGGDPWWILPERNAPLNAYGPLFNVLAAVAWVNPLGPKLLFAFGYVAFVAAVCKRSGAHSAGTAHDRGWRAEVYPQDVMPSGKQHRLSWPLLIGCVLNPFPWVEIAHFGHWEILVGLACVAAVDERRRGRDGRSGAYLTLGVLLKYLPVVLVPFLGFEDRRRVRFRVWLAFAVVLGLGLVASVAVWGDATFRPITLAATRGSNLLSIFRFLRGAWSPLRVFSAAPNLDKLALPCLATAGLAVWLWCRWRRVEPAREAVLAVLTTLLFYQVGFVSYQIVLFLLAAYWSCDTRVDRRLGIALAGYFGWIAAFDVWYCAIGGVIHPDDPWAWAQDVVGLPTFLLGAWLLVEVLRARDVEKETA